MALIFVRDVKQERDRILNTDFIYECREEGGAVRIKYAEGAQGRDSCFVAGGIDAFAKSVGAVKVG